MIRRPLAGIGRHKSGFFRKAALVMTEPKHVIFSPLLEEQQNAQSAETPPPSAKSDSPISLQGAFSWFGSAIWKGQQPHQDEAVGAMAPTKSQPVSNPRSCPILPGQPSTSRRGQSVIRVPAGFDYASAEEKGEIQSRVSGEPFVLKGLAKKL